MTTETGIVPVATADSPEILLRSPVIASIAQAVMLFAVESAFVTYTNLPEGSTVIEAGSSCGIHTSLLRRVKWKAV